VAAYESRGRGRAAAPGRGRGGEALAEDLANTATSTGQAKLAPIPSNKKEGAPMHPSWEAAKKRKEQRRWFPSKGRKLSSRIVLYVDRLLCRALIVHGYHYPCAFATTRVSQVWERVVVFKICVIYRPSKVNMVTSNVFSEVKGGIR
jgi:hypothetical protein